MFEMKNEGDETATKKRNEDFLKELDKDRSEKKCEFAVLVTLLESESELYNSGIVDVSHKFPKMYVVRPQFFIPIITLLRNAAMTSLKYKAELAMVRSQKFIIGWAYEPRLTHGTRIVESNKKLHHLLKEFKRIDELYPQNSEMESFTIRHLVDELILIDAH